MLSVICYIIALRHSFSAILLVHICNTTQRSRKQAKIQVCVCLYVLCKFFFLFKINCNCYMVCYSTRRKTSETIAYLITSQLMDNLDGSLGYSVVLAAHGLENFGYVAEGGHLV